MTFNRILISLLAVAALLFGGCTKGEESGGSSGGGSNTPKPGAIEVAEGKDLVGYVLWDDGSPAENVVVSDGFSCTKTDKNGIYQLTRSPKARNVFFSYPSTAEITAKSRNKVPDFFHSINAAANGVIRHDFTIIRRKTATPRRFQLIIFADSQIRLAKFGQHFSQDFCPDVNKTVAESNLPTIGITCGDDGDDNLWHQQRDKEDMTYQTVADCYGALSFPMFHCAGNHDHDRSHSVPACTSSKEDYYAYYKASVTPFEKAFNPVDHSFNYGNVHFVVMDNIRYYAPSTFDYGFTDEQIEWLRQDLSYVPTSMAVVVSLHASYYRRSWASNKSKFAKLLKPYANKIILIGHSHLNRYSEFEDADGGKMAEWMLATPMGVFWRTDCNHTGEPSGYGVMTFSGTEVIERYYKSAYYDRSVQGRLYDTSCFTTWKSEKDSDGVAWKDKVVGVVFERSQSSGGHRDLWTVELWEDGEYSQVMTRYTGKDYAVYDLLLKTDFKSKYLSIDEHPSVILYKAIPKKKGSVKSMRLVDWLGREYWVKDMTTSMDHLLTGMENGGK